MYIPHAQVKSECMFVSVDSVVLCNWLTASKTILLSASIKQHGHIATAMYMHWYENARKKVQTHPQ